MARRRPDTNLLDLRPRRLCQHLEAEAGRVSVQIPRFRARWLGWLQRRLTRPCVQLHLDELGSAFWLACDGQRDLHRIGLELRERFGPRIEPVWDRLALFARQLERGRLIALDG